MISLNSRLLWCSPLLLALTVACGSNSGPTVTQAPSGPVGSTTVATSSTLAESVGCTAGATGDLTRFASPLPASTSAGDLKLVVQVDDYAATAITIDDATFIPYPLDPAGDGNTAYVADAASQLVDLGSASSFAVEGADLAADTCVEALELIPAGSPTVVPEIVSNLYQNDPDQITLSDIGIQIAARQNLDMSVADPFTPANLAATANNLIPGDTQDVNEGDLNVSLMQADFDFADPSPDLTLADTAVLVANRVLIAFGDEITTANLLIQTNALLPGTDQDLETEDDIVTIPVGEPGGEVTIPQIQGAAHVSPFVTTQSDADFFASLPADTFTIEGATVTTTGVVTATDTNGFYVQDPVGDGDIATSDALFVFTGSAPSVEVGDAIEIEGTVAEFFPGDTDTRNIPTTQLSDATFTVLSSGNELPAPVLLGAGGRIPPSENIDDDAFSSFEPETDGIDFFESIEGMRVTAQNAVAVAGTNRFGEIFTVLDNGADATGISLRSTLNISPNDFNPEKVQIDEDSGILPGFDLPDVNVGAELGNITGVISYDFGNFQIQPTEVFTPASTGSVAPVVSTLTPGDAELTVASYNVLNLDPLVEDVALVDDMDDDEVDDDIGDGRFAAIADHIVNNLNAPDIIALQEVQDNDGAQITNVVAADVTLQTLINEITNAGGPTYQFIDNPEVLPIPDAVNTERPTGGQPGGNIRVAFLFNPARVSLVPDSVTALATAADTDDPGNTFFESRIPLAADFTFNDQTITVVNNHFSSKGGSAPILGIEQPFEARQEEVTVNGSLDERQAQSQVVQDFVDTILNTDPDSNVVVLGDLNEFEFISPVLDLGASLSNLADTLGDNERYSFIFQGNSQLLDHILVSNNLNTGAQFEIVHVNSEFEETPQRASDHDPLLAQLPIVPPPIQGEVVASVADVTAELLDVTPNGNQIVLVGGDELTLIDIVGDSLAVSGGLTFGDLGITPPVGFVEADFTGVDISSDGSFALVGVKEGDDLTNGLVLAVELPSLTLLASAEVGIGPDSVAIAPDGNYAAVANEAEGDEENLPTLPAGTISILDLTDLGNNNLTEAQVVDITGGPILFPDDPQPETVKITADSTQIIASLQENNGITVIDVTGTDSNGVPNTFDVTNIDLGLRDGQGITVEGDVGEGDCLSSNGYANAPVSDFTSAREPDGLALTSEFIVTADEDNIGASFGGGPGGPFGSRSISVFSIADGTFLGDSGNSIEEAVVNLRLPMRCEDKGPEPEVVDTGVINGRTLVFASLERSDAVTIHDITDPANIELLNTIVLVTDPESEDFVVGNDVEAQLEPEGIVFIPSSNQVVTANSENDSVSLINLTVNF